MRDRLGEEPDRECDSYPLCDSLRDELNGTKARRLSREDLAMLEMLGGRRKDD